MVKRIDILTPGQTARFGEWVDKWIEVGWRTGVADHQKFEKAAETCYHHAGITWHDNVIWVSSPLELSIIAPVATLMAEIGGNLPDGVHQAMMEILDGNECANTRSMRSRVHRDLFNAMHPVVYNSLAWTIDDPAIRLQDFSAQGQILSSVSHAVYKAVVAAVDMDYVFSQAERDINRVVYEAVDNRLAGFFQPSHSLLNPLYEEIKKVVPGLKSTNSLVFLGGQCDVGGSMGMTCHSFFRDVCHLDLSAELDECSRAYEATIESAGWWYAHRDFIIVCERPTVIHREPAGSSNESRMNSRLHCDNGPALVWPDGWGVYAFHGVRIPFEKRHIVEQPKLISLEEIEAESNVEIRRIMIERYGMEHYVLESDSFVIDQCPPDHPVVGLRTARLIYKMEGRDEPIVYLDMLNSTPELDGSAKRYMIRIDPHAYEGRAAKKCLAAMASTYRQADGSLLFAHPEDYAPLMET